MKIFALVLLFLVKKCLSGGDIYVTEQPSRNFDFSISFGRQTLPYLPSSRVSRSPNFDSSESPTQVASNSFGDVIIRKEI